MDALDRPRRRNRVRGAMRSMGEALVRHTKFIGPGIVASVAYFDPGNWSVDLQAGASYGYKLLFVVLVAGLGAIVLQTQATRLGIVSGLDLARQIRLLLHDCKRHTLLIRWGVLYPIYVLAEIAIIATDLAELLGSAIALNLLFPRLPLWAGVLLTSVDVLLVLAFFQGNQNTRKGMFAFELIIVALVLAVFACFAVLVIKVGPDWSDAFFGYVPSKEVFGPGALYTSVGIIGATVMPHALFIGSRLATVDRLDLLPVPAPPPPRKGSLRKWRLPSRDIFGMLPSSWRKADAHRPSVAPDGSGGKGGAAPASNIALADRKVANGLGHDRATDARKSNDESDEDLRVLERLPSHRRPSTIAETRETPNESSRSSVSAAAAEGDDDDADDDSAVDFNRLEFIRRHITHATADIVFSLVGFAITINSAILIMSAAAFFNNPEAQGADLFAAHRLIESYLGHGPALLFAIALLCSGQSASITATLAGQVVSEGFIEWKTSPLVRRLVTRLIGMVPSMVVAIAVGRSGIDTLLVISQVILSIVLPFVVAPLVYITSSDVMVVKVPPSSGRAAAPASPSPGGTSPSPPTPDAENAPAQTDAEAPDQVVSFRSGWLTTGCGWLIFAVVVVANTYVIVSLGMGTAG